MRLLKSCNRNWSHSICTANSGDWRWWFELQNNNLIWYFGFK